MGCDFWMDARREAPELLGKANERIWQLEAQVTKLEAQLAEAELKAGALKLACDYIADYTGTCPSDMFNFDATEGEIFSFAYCEDNCDITTTGKCYEQWFILKQQEATK